MVLCDTNIFIEIYRGNVAVHAVLEKIGYENIIVSDVTRAELLYGAINKTELYTLNVKDFTFIPNLKLYQS